MSKFKVANDGGDDWLICWTGQDENGKHWNVTTDKIHASELFQFSKGAEEDARLIAELLDLHYSKQIVKLEELKQVEANYDALQSPMPCGHLARYAVNEKDGTQYCLMCDRNALMEAGQKALEALENRNALFEKACLFLAYSNYGVNADKFVDLPADVQSFVLGLFCLEVRP